MQSHSHVMAGLQGRVRKGKSRWPARMDLAQSLSGLLLGLFMWVHMVLVSSILISKDAMWIVAKAFEGFFVFGRSVPALVSMAVGGVSMLVVLHAFLAMRKFPANFHQYSSFTGHRALLRHGDTTLWWLQVVTGFALFFLVLGLASLAAYIKIGVEHGARVGERYTPAWVQPAGVQEPAR